MSNRFNLTGHRFGILTALEELQPRIYGKTKSYVWRCLCDCGNERIIPVQHLRYGRRISCGCLQSEAFRIRSTKHGESGHAGGRGTIRYELWRGAKVRAREKGLPFNLIPSDIIIPDVCPVLGCKMDVNRGGKTALPNSPSLDRVDPALGYVRGNVCVISHRANVLKSDATINEMKMVLACLRGRDVCGF